MVCICLFIKYAYMVAYLLSFKSCVDVLFVRISAIF